MSTTKENQTNTMNANSENDAIIVKKDEITSMVKNIISNMESKAGKADMKLYFEIKEIMDLINSTKVTLDGIKPCSISNEFIPSATDELDEIVKATESATDKILNSSERIEELSNEFQTFDKKKADELSEQVINIYEACNFQDITGQRVTKVVNTLRSVEEKVNSLLQVIGHTSDLGNDNKGENKGKDKEQNKSETESKSARNGDGEVKLENGPALPGEGHSQDEIDALMQNEIDALFD